MTIHIRPINVLVMLLCIVSFLTIANIMGIIYILNFSPDNIYHLIRWFDFSLEVNIPTFFSTFIIMVSSILLFVIGMTHKRMGNRYALWILLSFIFLFLSFDETVQLHERQVHTIRNLLDTSGYLYFAWIIPYSIVLFILLLIYIRFLMRLPKTALILFLVSGGIYISGAIGMELISGNHAEQFGQNNITYYIYVTLEELIEMTGMSIFIYSLLSYISIEFKFLEFYMR